MRLPRLPEMKIPHTSGGQDLSENKYRKLEYRMNGKIVYQEENMPFFYKALEREKQWCCSVMSPDPNPMCLFLF